MNTLHWTIHDLEFLPDDGNRYEIIDGELYVAKQPDWEHQLVSGNIYDVLKAWNRQTKAGKANFTPGIIFTDDTNVVPDIVWISRERLKTALQKDGKLHASPELVVEVLSPGIANERRDRVGHHILCHHISPYPTASPHDKKNDSIWLPDCMPVKNWRRLS